MNLSTDFPYLNDYGEQLDFGENILWCKFQNGKYLEVLSVGERSR